jgi:nucleoside-diphosphate-sugar epimerase
MRVLITGGVGNVGTAVIDRLSRAGHELRVIGRRGGQQVPGAQYAQCDITDIGCLVRLLEGFDAIVHLAALGNPSLGSPDEVFRINCAGTFNIYEAAARTGIRRVVTASSINALGFGFGVRDFTVRYLPIDEEHPTSPTDAYSFSKNVVEEIADFSWRREGIASVCLRLPAVVPQPWNEEGPIREFVAKCRAEMAEILALDPRARRERYEGWMRRLEEGRRRRLHEQPPKGWTGMFPDLHLMGTRADFWCAVDDRDCAQAVEQGLTTGLQGSHRLFIVDSHNRAGIPSRTLAEIFYPSVTTWKKPVEGTGSLVSIDRARALLGYEPQYSAARFFE